MDETKKSIKHWSEQDQPREKMIAGGTGALSDSELIAILLVTGIKNQSAIDVARHLLNSVHHDINTLASLSIADLKKIKGIGDAKAITILAALELGRRRSAIPKKLKQKIVSAKDAADLFDELKYNKHEEFWIACLNQSSHVVNISKVHQGGITQVVADARLFFKIAIEHHATAVIIAHNHPSGNLKPSNEDIAITSRFKGAGTLLDIRLVDHLIITENGFFSFADEGLL